MGQHGLVVNGNAASHSGRGHQQPKSLGPGSMLDAQRSAPHRTAPNQTTPHHTAPHLLAPALVLAVVDDVADDAGALLPAPPVPRRRAERHDGAGVALTGRLIAGDAPAIVAQQRLCRYLWARGDGEGGRGRASPRGASVRSAGPVAAVTAKFFGTAVEKHALQLSAGEKGEDAFQVPVKMGGGEEEETERRGSADVRLLKSRGDVDWLVGGGWWVVGGGGEQRGQWACIALHKLIVAIAR